MLGFSKKTVVCVDEIFLREPSMKPQQLKFLYNKNTLT